MPIIGILDLLGSNAAHGNMPRCPKMRQGDGVAGDTGYEGTGDLSCASAVVFASTARDEETVHWGGLGIGGG
jgi:hypothetical protein